MSGFPTWQDFMIPILNSLHDGQERRLRELYPMVADDAGLTEDQRTEWLASGNQLKYQNRIGWAVSYLSKVGAINRPRRGTYQISAAGLDVLRDFSGGVRESDIRRLGEDDNSLIRPYESEVEARSRSEDTVETEATQLTPLEQVNSGIERIHEEVASDLLARLRERDPGFFEAAVVELLVAMGYGGATGKGNVTQATNDGGIDGVIDQDILGLSRVYIQAKRYGANNSVGRPDLQAFVGALSGRADSGVFITTSYFSPGAKAYAAAVPTRIILIDGVRLGDLMIRFGVGVQVRHTYKVVEIDEDFFA